LESIFTEFALLLLISAVGGAIAVWLRQPLLVAYIVVGILAGPAGFNWGQAHEQIGLLAQVGITVLLFVVGLKLDLRHIRHIGPVALATGLGQLAFTIILGFLILLALDRAWIEALYVAVALTFSSTIIIVKLLSDKRELDSLHGRIAVGFLIVQDLAVVVAMTAMSTLGAVGDGSATTGSILLMLLARLVVSGLLLWLLMRFVLPPVVKVLARSQELLLIFAIAWGTSLAALGEFAGFSKEAGAFLAGFSLASTAYREAISARLASVRDFLLLFFFIDLGSKLDFSVLGAEVGSALVLSAFVLIGNPLIVMAIMGYMGYRKRTGFLAGLTVAQISEFSIVFIAMGISLGHIQAGNLGLVTLVGLVTIALSSYMIIYSHRLYEFISPWLGMFERQRPFRELDGEGAAVETAHPDVIIFGLGRYGGHLSQALSKRRIAVLGVDFDPEAVRVQQEAGLAARFGDGEAPDFMDTLPLAVVPWVVSTLPGYDANKGLMHALESHGYTGRIAMLARDADEVERMATFDRVKVIEPFKQAADFAALELAAHIVSAESARREATA
jgi:Kef-type K+ transport system membrane component KefB